MEISEISIQKIGLASAEPSVEDYRECGQSIFEAFSKIGFAYIRHHGIEDSTVEKVFERSRQFFSLPVETKNLVRNVKGSDQGYVARGQEIFDASEDAEKVRQLLLLSLPLVLLVMSLSLPLVLLVLSLSLLVCCCCYRGRLCCCCCKEGFLRYCC